MKRVTFIFVCLSFATLCQARTITVDDDGLADFSTIQAAIDDSNNGDVIIVAPGTYTGPGNLNIDFRGKAIAVRSQNGPEVTILACKGEGRGFQFLSGETVTSKLCGFTIRQGGLPATNWGGGIYCLGSSPTITDCVITENVAGKGGGVLCENGASPTLVRCRITRNRGEGGAGILCVDDTDFPTLINCTISENIEDGNGGGIVFYGNGSVTLINCTVSGNVLGGGICGGNAPLLINCAIIGNYLGAVGSTSPTLINCTVADNGGGVSGDATLTNCIVWGNCGGSVSYTDKVSYSCIESVELWPGIGNINQNPLFLSRGHWDDSGTPGEDWQVMRDDVWVNGDYRLRPDSPCINTGDPNYVVEPNETDLDGKPRVMGSRVDMGAYEAVLPEIEVTMKFTPQAINCNSKGKWVKTHFVLPEEFAVEDVDANTPAKIESLGIKSDHLNVFINEDGVVEIEAAFERVAFCDAIAGCGPIEITVVGLLTRGQYFYGTDTIKIIKNNFECLAILSSHWLEMNCGKPDWCNGFDADRDTTVNLKDFAFMAFHWLEER